MADPNNTPVAEEVHSTLGFRDVVIAPLVTDEEGETPEYGAVVPLVAAIDLDLSDNGGDPDIQYYDDHEGDVIYPDPELQGTLELAALTAEKQALVLGARVDQFGGLLRNASDKPPYFALGCKSEMTNGEDKYVWFYKARFRMVSEKYTTKQGKTINRQTAKLQLTCIKRTCDGNWQYSVDSSLAAFATKKAAFFDTVYEPTFAQNNGG